MRSGVQQVALLMVLVGGVLVGGDHHQHPEPEDCDALTKRLSTAELDKVLGDWVLVWSVARTQANKDLLKNTTSSHVELRLLPDNQTVLFHERNVYRSNVSSCVSYIFKLSVQPDSENLTLHTTETNVEIDGVLQDYNRSAELEFHLSSSNSLQILYKEEEEGFLLSYRREGHHQDVEEQKASHDFLKKQAECLKFSTDGAYVYDGVSDFCHKKSSVEVKAEES